MLFRFNSYCKKLLNVSNKVVKDRVKCWRNCCSSTSLPEIMKEFSKYSGGQIKLSQDDECGIAYLCLDNPDKRNALTGKMMVELSEFVTQLENWKNGKAMILYSQGNTFCSGADLTTVKNITDPEGAARMSHLMHNTLYRLSTLPLITVALIQGKALGGGAELSLACDFRLLAPSASIQFVQLKMGTITGFGGATRLVGLLGQTVALKVLLSSQKLDAAETLKLKLADEVLSENEDLLEQTKRWLDPYLHGSSEVIRAMKKAMAYAAWSNSEDSFSNERKLFSTVWGGPANLEALKKNIKH